MNLSTHHIVAPSLIVVAKCLECKLGDTVNCAGILLVGPGAVVLDRWAERCCDESLLNEWIRLIKAGRRGDP